MRSVLPAAAAATLILSLGLAAGGARSESLPLGAPEPLGLAPEQIRQLEDGELLVRPLEPDGGQGLAVRAMQLLGLPPAQVWPVVRDCDRFDEFMPRTKRAEAGHTEDGGLTCDMDIDMPFPVRDLHSEVRVVLERLPDGGFRRRWSLLWGDYERNNGAWTVLPWGAGGQRTLLIYQVDARPKTAVPDFVVRAAQSVQLPSAYRAIAGRAATLAAEPEADVAAGPEATR